MGEVLARYVNDKGLKMQSAQTLAYSISALGPFWANLTCDAVKGSTCRMYERERGKPVSVKVTSKLGKVRTVVRQASTATVRRELGVLQAALNHAHEEGLLIHPIKVALPDAGAPRDRWLKRQEAARLLRHASPHVRRFILMALYTGRRASALLELTWARVDLDAGVIRFRADGATETNKRRGRVKMPRQLRLHLMRWKRMHEALSPEARKHDTHVISFRGQPVGSIKRGIERAAARAGLADVTPHVLKHTAITWPIMRGLGLEDAAEYFDTSPETIRRHYWHHSPHHQARAVEMVEGR